MSQGISARALFSAANSASSAICSLTAASVPVTSISNEGMAGRSIMLVARQAAICPASISSIRVGQAPACRAPITVATALSTSAKLTW